MLPKDGLVRCSGHVKRDSGGPCFKNKGMHLGPCLASWIRMRSSPQNGRLEWATRQSLMVLRRRRLWRHRAGRQGFRR